jgi:hypothetical protein
MKTFQEFVQEKEQLMEEGRIIDTLKRLGLPLVLAGSLMMTSTGCSPKPESMGDKYARHAAEAINKANIQMRNADYSQKIIDLSQKADRLKHRYDPPMTQDQTKAEIDRVLANRR